MTEIELLKNAIVGCAVGDGLGCLFEFNTVSIREFTNYYNSLEPMEVTDDTQMTLFSLEALVHAYQAGDTSVAGVVSHLADAYQAWYTTQLGKPNKEYYATSRLLNYRALYERRAPGNTCMSSLAALQEHGRVPDNDRKGNGANMRVVPLAFLNLIGIPSDSSDAMAVVTGSALITHKHPLLLELMPIQQRLMANVKGNQDFVVALGKTFEVEPPPQWLLDAMDNADTVEGWTADQALAVAIVANYRYDNFMEIMAYCICRKGDSDTIAAIAGGFWGMSGKPVPDMLWQRVREKLLIEDFLGWCSARILQ